MSSNMNNIKYDDFKNICRMCMLNCDEKFYQDCVVSNIYHKLTDLHFETNDHLPKQICRKCFEKINEIHEFALKCKRTHTALMECLNNQQNVVQIKNIKKIIILDKIVTTDVQSNSTDNNNQMDIIEETNEEFNDCIIQGICEIKEEVDNTDLQETSNNLEEKITIEEYKIEFVKDEHVINETSEINNDQSINCSEDPLLISNTSNINVKSEETFNDNTILNDINEDTISSNCSKIPNINSSKTYKNEEDLYMCSQSSRTFVLHNEQSVKCKLCLKSFTRFDSLKMHMLTHTGERPFKCKHCPKSFTQSGNLKSHMRTHSGDRPFKCEHCSKSFSQSSHLKTHTRTHTGDRPFKCEQCSKSFINSCVLEIHMRTHTGELPFKCKHCSNSFNQSGILKTHMLTHTGDRPFNCELCSKSFRQLGNLKSHMRTHTGERPFKCEHCSKSFIKSSDMKTHLRTHTGERPNICSQCSKTFSHLSSLKRHMLTHHKNYKGDV